MKKGPRKKRSSAQKRNGPVRMSSATSTKVAAASAAQSAARMPPSASAASGQGAWKPNSSQTHSATPTSGHAYDFSAGSQNVAASRNASPIATAINPSTT